MLCRPCAFKYILCYVSWILIHVSHVSRSGDWYSLLVCGVTVLVGFERDDALFLCTLGFWYPIFFSYYDLLVVEYVVVVYFIRLLGSGRDDYVSFSVLGVMVFIILDLLYD